MAAFAADTFPAGSWYGQGQPYDKSEMWLAHLLPGGEFRAQFRSCRKGKATDVYETGNWTLWNGIETIRIATHNGQFSPRTDVYQILSHDAHKQSYRYLPTGFLYNSSRVDDNFPMPPCELVS